MCPRTYDTSMLALLFSSRKFVAVSTNFCDICWLDPDFSFVIEATEDVLSANSMIFDRFLFSSGIASWNSIVVSSPLKHFGTVYFGVFSRMWVDNRVEIDS